MLYEVNGRAPQVHPQSFVAPSANLIGQVTIEKEASVWFNAVMRGDVSRIVLGEGSNFQDGSVAHGDTGKDVIIGKNVTIGHNAIIHACTIGDGCLIAMGAIVLSGAKIGKNCLIAAGAVVSEGMEIPDNSLAVGVPAKVVKEISSLIAQRMQIGSRHYIDKIKEYNTLKLI
ncbi:MAG: gamma carbonic anhydrase family protein [Spirochaetaceae bacterium]|nr:gamma carbonic anhydrase family protein [Spirochaetaceae bacterium]